MPGGQPHYAQHDDPAALEDEFRQMARRIARLEEQLQGVGQDGARGRVGPPGEPGPGASTPTAGQFLGQGGGVVKHFVVPLRGSNISLVPGANTIETLTPPLKSPFIVLDVRVRVLVGSPGIIPGLPIISFDVTSFSALQHPLVPNGIVQGTDAMFAYLDMPSMPLMGDYRMRSGPLDLDHRHAMSRYEEHKFRINQTVPADFADTENFSRARFWIGVPVRIRPGILSTSLRVRVRHFPVPGSTIISFNYLVIGTYIDGLLDTPEAL